MWNMCGVMLMDRVRNEQVVKRTGVTGVGWSNRAEYAEVEGQLM